MACPVDGRAFRENLLAHDLRFDLYVAQLMA